MARRSPAAFARDERGAAMVEFSVIAFLLLVMVFGMVDYGRYFLLRANLTNAVREGARYGATLSGAPNVAPNLALIEAYTRARITAGNSASGTVTPTQQGAGTATDPSRVRVAISGYPFNPATFLVIKTAKTITVQAEFRKEALP